MAAIGHPLLGDPVYGGRPRRGDVLAPALAGFKRQALDAVVLGFRHPTRPDTLRFTKKYDRDFSSLIDRLDKLQNTLGKLGQSV
jgi:23S rRNA pseudouridine1911/1915/1917 synthase